jgi:hypothetical protein
MAGQRVRRIVVDGEVYRWRVRRAGPHWVGVRFWRDGERVPLADVRVRCDDRWLLHPDEEVSAREAVRPGEVAELIRARMSVRP